MTARLRLDFVPEAPTDVERELAGLIGGASLEDLGKTVGHADHSGIAKRVAKAISGKVDGYSDALTFGQGLRLAAAFAPLGDAAANYLKQQRAEKSAGGLESGVSGEIADDAVLIQRCNAALADGRVDPSERRLLVAALRESANRRALLIARLEQGGG